MTDNDLRQIASENVSRKVNRLSASVGVWSIEPHGPTVSLYAGRYANRHGNRLMNLDNGDDNFDANCELIITAANDNVVATIDALLTLVEQQRMLIADLSQDGRNVEAYQRGVEEGKRLMTELLKKEQKK